MAAAQQTKMMLQWSAVYIIKHEEQDVALDSIRVKSGGFIVFTMCVIIWRIHTSRRPNADARLQAWLHLSSSHTRAYTIVCLFTGDCCTPRNFIYVTDQLLKCAVRMNSFVLGQTTFASSKYRPRGGARAPYKALPRLEP